MGGCFSDVRGGQQAVGSGGPAAGAAPQELNDAVGYFLHSRGLRGLFTTLELSFSASKLRNLDVLSKMLNLNEQDYLGEASCALSEIVTKPSRSTTLNLQHQRGHSGLHSGTITIHAEETVSSRVAVEMILRCSKLENKDTFSKSDPFLRISKIVESGSSIPICKTEVINDNLNPVWKPVTLSVQQFGSKACLSYSDNPLIIECFDFNSSGKHDLIGKLQTSMSDLEKLGREKNGANFYVSSVARPDNKKAIIGVGEVLQFYDSDRRFLAWGFGGRIAYGSVSHCFNLNGNSEESEVSGVEGIMSAYAMALHNVALAGPTLFGPVINKAAEIASRSLSTRRNKYFILLIITDGVITDLQETKDAIVKASDLPMSILIVGVGGADYKEMEILDADNGKRLESSTGRIATRDIVQFVPMRDVQGSQVSVVQALLEELPGQFLSYMQSRDITPHPAHPREASAPPFPQ
ncbi:Copine [Musa troglodytarum]|uniref:Copine n=1 Tax=Musa troglodytarum TaxID=320322 RepID=A0A9E7G1L6_9LILI|nr:Copine [Musa troglodytarum]